MRPWLQGGSGVRRSPVGGLQTLDVNPGEPTCLLPPTRLFTSIDWRAEAPVMHHFAQYLVMKCSALCRPGESMQTCAAHTGHRCEAPIVKLLPF